MNNSYQQGSLLEFVQPVRATGCNQCRYSPFTYGSNQYVWVGYKLTCLVLCLLFVWKVVSSFSFWLCLHVCIKHVCMVMWQYLLIFSKKKISHFMLEATNNYLSCKKGIWSRWDSILWYGAYSHGVPSPKSLKSICAVLAVEYGVASPKS